MSKKDIDFSQLGFGYIKTDKRYCANYVDGKWEKGQLVDDANIVLNECAGILQYCQECFEGLKAYTTVNGDVVTFRPDLNAKRMIESALRLEMPPYPENEFLEAVDMVVKANIDWIPPYGSGASFYLRPYMFGSTPVIGVKPADGYQFRIFGTPVGPYFKGGVKPLKLRVPDFDRAAPNGTGNIKAGLNYAMSLHPLMIAHREGYDENMYLDSATRTFVEETGGANFIFVTGENEVITPKSESILPSITRQSILYVAKNYLGLKVDERKIRYEELKEFKEAGLCGTAAVISPVYSVVKDGAETVFEGNKDGMGDILKKIYDILTGIQQGTVEAPCGWIRKIM